MSLRFVWLSDVSIDEPGRYGAGEPAATVAYINSTLAPDFVIMTGDAAYDPTDVAHYTLYKTTIVDAMSATVYSLPGNHDQQGGAFVNYESVLGPVHFTPFTAGPLRIIGIVPDETVDLHATMSASELTYLETQLIAASGDIPLVFSHYPIQDSWNAGAHITTGATELLALLSAYNVKGYFSGHLHMACATIIQAGTTHVNGDALVPALGDTTDCGMMICDLYSDRISIDYVRGTSPWDSISTLTVDLGTASDRHTNTKSTRSSQHAQPTASRQYTRPV